MSTNPIFAALFRDMSELGLLPQLVDSLRDVPVPKSPTDSEQHAPFTAPTEAEVAAMRDGIEAHKRRNAEATPVGWSGRTHEGSEL